MLGFLKNEANKTFTENGAVTYASTCSDCLDLFAAIGALRRESDGEIIGRFVKAYAEDPNLAMKTLFFARDVRGGLGERRVFRVILSWLAANEPASVRKNVEAIARYGRFDDLLWLLGTPCESDALACVKKQLDADLAALENGGDVSLLAKWLPSVNASNAVTVHNAKRIARALGMDDAVYRRTLVKLRAHIRIIENNLREGDYTFDYVRQPSKAMFKYRKAFLRNDGERYQSFMDKVSSGEAKLHTGALTPYDIIAPFFNNQVPEAERSSINATWNAQEDFSGDDNALVVVDGSGSMYGGCDPLPAAVALSLGIYFSERNTGAFKNHFITFSEHPQLVKIKGATFWKRSVTAASTTSVPTRTSRKCLSLFSPLRSKTRCRRRSFRKRCISSPIWSLTTAPRVPEQRTSNMPKISLPHVDMNCPVSCSGTWPAAAGSNPSPKTNRASRSYPAAPRASSPCCKAEL